MKFDASLRAVSLEEKPAVPKSNHGAQEGVRSHMDPPISLELSLAEAILLVGVLEDALTVLDRLARREPLQIVDVIGPMLGLEDQLRMLEAKLNWPGGEPDE